MADLYGQVILVAEEKYFIAESVARVLEQSGADVLGPVGTLGGALTLLEVLSRVDGAVLDITLHDEAIAPLLDALEARGIPYVFATGDGEAAIPDQYQHMPRWTKPFRLEDLSKRFEGLMRR
jgi:DNA-binding LytR/AlgR family response regulator